MSLIKLPIKQHKLLHLRNHVLVLSILAISYVVFQSRSNGPANNNLGDLTGGPLSWGNCNACHNGGTWQVTNTINIYQTGTSNLVTSYIPNTNYDIVILVSSTSPRKGFQMTALTTANNMAGTFFSPGPQTQLVVDGYTGITYAEHSSPSISGIFSTKWTSPPAGTGDVTFYMSGLAAGNPNNSNGDNAISSNLVLTEGAPLPVRFSQVNIQSDKTGNTISWNMQHEDNVIRYDIERSTNSVDFYIVGEVASNPTLGSRYQYTDKQALNGLNYYRIRAVDADQKMYYSSVIKADNSFKNADLLLAPNPGNGLVQLLKNNVKQVKVLDMKGQTLLQHANIVNGKLDLSGLADGHYVIQVMYASGLISNSIYTKR